MPSVTIIGAGPAGSIAALLLARSGWDVVLIEQHRFPRDKVCGECLSSLGIDVLKRTGLDHAIEALKPAVLCEAAMMTTRGQALLLDLPNSMWGISRCALDVVLLEAARTAGASIFQPARCERVCEQTMQVRYRRLESNCIESRRSDYILLADGRAAHRSPRPRQTLDLGIKAHFSEVQGELGRISLFGLSGHYAGLAPIESRRWNLAMSVPARKVRAFGGDLDALFDAVLKENPLLRDRMKSARRLGEWLAAPLPRFGVQRNWRERIIPLGNAAAAIEPIGGEGMGLAMCSAERVAEHLIASDGESRAVSTAGLRSQMKTLWRRKRIGCRAGAVMLSHRRLSRMIAPIASPLAPLALRLIGK